MPDGQLYVVPSSSHLSPHVPLLHEVPVRAAPSHLIRHHPQPPAWMPPQRTAYSSAFPLQGDHKRHPPDVSKVLIMIVLIIFCLTLSVAIVFSLRGAEDNDDDNVEVDREKNGRTTKMPMPKAVVIPGVEKGAPGEKTPEPGTVAVPTTTPAPTPEVTTQPPVQTTSLATTTTSSTTSTTSTTTTSTSTTSMTTSTTTTPTTTTTTTKATTTTTTTTTTTSTTTTSSTTTYPEGSECCILVRFITIDLELSHAIKVKEILCTVGHTAVMPDMYPPERLCQYLYYTDVVIDGGHIRASLVQDSWKLFQMKARNYQTVEGGIGFDYRYIARVKIYAARRELHQLAKHNLEHYGLLNVITKPNELNATVESLKPIIEALKDVQDNDPEKQTVIAIGSLTYKPEGFQLKYTQIIERVVNTFNADAVIAVSSVSTMESNEECYAAPPNVLSSPAREFPSLETHWPLVRANATYANRRTLVGLSFEMGTMLYVLESDVVSPQGGAYAKCTGFGITSRDAICGTGMNSEQFLDEPYVVYGTFLRDDNQNYVAFAEYYTSCRDKFLKARTKYGPVRRRLAWMLFNVHLVDVTRKCVPYAFIVAKMFCQAIRGEQQCE